MGFAEGLMLYLSVNKILFKDGCRHFQEISERIKAASIESAEKQHRPVIYLPSSETSKEEVALKIARKDRIDSGLIGILTCVEGCQLFEFHRDRKARTSTLKSVRRRCLHYYHYFDHAELGRINVRLQTWFPFTIQVCMNGREWLARTMDKKGIPYRKTGNCFNWIEDVEQAQRLATAQLATDWPRLLEELAGQVNPLYPDIFGKFDTQYYWSTAQSEWATDVMFKSPAHLAEIYPRLVRHGLLTFKSQDVMRFLGHYVSAKDKLHPWFKNEVNTSFKERQEGVRVKHSVSDNSVKMYDKGAGESYETKPNDHNRRYFYSTEVNVLRIESTVNSSREFKVFRSKEGGPKDEKSWLPMRKGIADLQRRAEVSQASNERYLSALAKVENDRSLEECLDGLCSPVKLNGQQIRGLNPFGADAPMLAELGRGEFSINGFRNRDLQEHLYKGNAKNKSEQKKRSGKVTRTLRMLRAHGII